VHEGQISGKKIEPKRPLLDILALRCAQTFKALRVRQHLTPLLGQGADLTCKRLLPRHADVKHLLGFLPSGKTT